MLNQQLIDIINSEEGWAFVGSGCSVHAGLPSWQELLSGAARDAESSIEPLPAELKKKLVKHKGKGDFPEAFSVLKSHYGGAAIDSLVTHMISTNAEPGEVTRLLARWPFASYVTTNYDDLLERALGSYGGWVGVGNTADENAKISSDVRQVVWHPHGGVSLGTKNSRLVLASIDYDEIYPAGSPTLSALEAVCRMKRIIFVGFGFRDADLVTTLQRIARLVTPARPAFGFLADCSERDRQEYWHRYKIEIIPYVVRGNDHSDLVTLLRAYGCFVLDRGARFGRQFSTPDYDIQTVGLLTHNRLCRTDWVPNDDAIDCIAKGLVLAQLRLRAPLSVDQLVKEIPQGSAQTEKAVRRVVTALIDEGAITEINGLLRLSSKGEEIARQGKSEYELARDQFLQSMKGRAAERCTDKSLVPYVADVTARYLERTCRERGLGVAQQLAETGDVVNRARAVALLQGAKLELEFAPNRESALKAVACIWEILSAPRAEERRYLGLLTQAYFGRHLLGTDPAAIRIQHTNLSSTVFIADSNFIIPLLAVGSVGHQYALTLYEKLVSLNCKVVTSDLLLEEFVEHGRWAWNLLNDEGSLSPKTIDAARGARGYRPNAFLVGYLNHPEFGPGESFKRYFALVFDSDGGFPKEGTLAECLRGKGIVVQPLSDWRGFTDEMLVERDEVQKEIERRRRWNSTFTHDRQVKAEAEVAVTVTRVRQRELSLLGHDTRDAFFLSHSRVVDDLPKQAHRICLTPESLLEWILTIKEVTQDDANAIFDQLLWAISKDGVDVIPRKQLLRLFHNTIDASQEKLGEVLSEHREIIRDRYAVDPDKAFLEVDPLSLPGAAEEISREVLTIMKERLSREQQWRSEAEARAKTVIKDSKEYERLKAEKKERQAKAKRKKRAIQSSSGGKKGKKKH